MKKLPVAITTFEDIRTPSQNYLYIDKTKIACRLINKGKYYFLSRPRRFGKSLFIDTLSELFQAKKDLFCGLYIHDKWNWNEEYPVILINFGSGSYKSKASIQLEIERIFTKNQNQLNIDCNNMDDVRGCLLDLIEKSYQKYKQKVVILVDEYDKPILDNIDDKPIALHARELLRNLYSGIKDSDKYIKFVFITGVFPVWSLSLLVVRF